MDLSTIIGLVVGIGGILLGYVLEGGAIGALIAIPSMFIIFGGTIGAVMVTVTMKEISAVPRLVGSALKLHKSSESELIEVFVRLSEVARKEGLLSLENIIEQEVGDNYDPMLKKGIRMVVDGTELELVKNMFETEIYIHELQGKTEVGMFEAAGGFSPTMGVIGTVMGMIKILGNLTNPEELSKSIAGAFIATLYGVFFANIVYLPIASKLKYKGAKEALEKELIMEGVLSIQAGENPAIIREKLSAFIPHGSKKAAAAAPKEEE